MQDLWGRYFVYRFCLKIDTMRTFYFLPFLILASISLNGQELMRQRTADLEPLDYSITGDAILEEYDDGSLKLRLTEDFTTPTGPDVRVYLSNGATTSGGVEVADLSEVDHFSGARTFDVPAGVTLEEYSRVFFYCRAFSLPWADGAFGEPVNLGGGFECLASTAFSTDGATEIKVCPTDGAADVVSLLNSLGTPAGEHYAYLITDKDEVVLEVVTGDSYDFEASGADEQRVYGIHFDGELNAVVGENRLQTTAVGCFTHSSDTEFLTISKDGCETTFECRESLVATHNWVTEVDVCSTDGAMDTVFLKNNIGVAVGEHYAFLLTDTNEIVREVITTDLYDFENTGTEKVRVYGVHFGGELMAAVGESRRNTVATGCSTHSGDDTFLTVDRTAACATTSVVDQALAAAVIVYPNPAANTVNVELPEGFRPGRASLLNAYGRVVTVLSTEDAVRSFQLDIASLPAGQYVLRLEDGRRTAAKRVSVVR